ncbi:ankyrin repeat domain-containing protein [Paraburkholderia unamae]|uniref:Ankyrin repeat protein n=1 Tax=Paraburkholderia unamae TaxID=219649 RepID=A0ABX5KRP3_9BURK|nr:ankyrin repeat domain-containing protein [Paraburkholderia unamae]PVX85464.1 ankyrin repeat protein [Paraburkholderia unamae]RAR55325.1 ankyrin repeat protein [Paraburkholderia unamae]CAG9267836.1 Ankyrin repeat protein [Paraburkholderia unamae]
MSLHTDTVPFVRESGNRRPTPSSDAKPLGGVPAALATWLSNHDFPDAHSRGLEGTTPLMLAALHGDDGLVEALLAHGVRVDALDDTGNQALWYACLGGAPAPILRLINEGAEIDHANDDDITCLMQAAASGRVELMQLLLAHGASEGLYAPDGRNALDMAAERGFELLRVSRRLGGGTKDAPRAPERQRADPQRGAISAHMAGDKAA